MSVSWERSALIRLEVDEVWKRLGRYGRYQLLQVLTLTVAGMSMAYPVLSVVFEGANNHHTCRAPASLLEDSRLYDNNSVRSEKCRVIVYHNDSEERELETSACAGYDFQLPSYTSFVSEWELVCGRAALAQLSQTVVMAGMFAGATLLANLADRFGRKRTHVGCHMALLATSLAMAFMPNYVSFVASKFFIGLFQQGYMIPLVIHLLEMLPTEQRAFMGVFGSVLWAMSCMTMSPIAFVMRNYSWRSLQIVFASFHAVCFLEMFVLDESLQWIVANRLVKDIHHVINKAARFNHVDPDAVFFGALSASDALRRTETDGQPEVNSALLSSIAEVPEETAEATEDQSEVQSGENVEGTLENTGDRTESSDKAERGRNGRDTTQVPSEEEEEGGETIPVERHHEGFLDLVKDPDMRFLTLTMLYVWMTNSLTYYGVTLLSSSLAGNTYLNFFLGGLIEIPSNFFMWIGLSRFGRKKTTILFVLLAGLSLLAASVVAAVGGGREAGGVAQTALSLVARFGISGSFNAIWVYTPELFPTNLRNLGVGLASSSARVGGMAAPFFKLLSDVAIWAPGVIFSVSCLLVTFLLTLLPETKHRSLPQTINDVRTWRRVDRKEKQ